MRAGQLCHSVILQTLQSGQDEIGQPLTTWVDVVTSLPNNHIPAKVLYLSGLSAIKAGADVSLTKASILMRYRAVSAGQRVKHGDVVFDIQVVLPDARRVYVDLVCETVG